MLITLYLSEAEVGYDYYLTSCVIDPLCIYFEELERTVIKRSWNVITFVLTRYKFKCDIINSSCFGFFIVNCNYKWEIAILTGVEMQSVGC